MRDRGGPTSYEERNLRYMVTHVVGVDPGLVHTGVVRLVFNSAEKNLAIEHAAIEGKDHTSQAWDWITDAGGVSKVKDFGHDPYIFIEDYNPRSAFNTDKRMGDLVRDMKAGLGGTLLLNTGVKKVVRRELMEVLGVWKFSTPTHHQDLRSAARIALYGMLKNDDLNAVVTSVLVDHINEQPWYVHV